MASIFRRPSGSWTVEVYLQDRKKHKINLPTKSQREARRVADNVQRLVNCRKSGLEPDDLLPWIDKLKNDGPAIYERLGELGLVEIRAEQPHHTLGEIVGILSSSRNGKPNDSFATSIKILFRFFPENVDLCDLTPQRIFEFMTWFRTPAAKSNGGAYSDATISRAVGHFRSVFSLAIKFGWISENPFLLVRRGSMSNTDNWHYMTKEFVINKISQCRMMKYGLCVALARFAGVRGLSELKILKWEDVHFSDNGGYIVIHAPKVKGTSHEYRTVPLSPLLEKYLLEWKKEHAETFVFENVILRETIHIARSVIGNEFPKPWYNLRKSFCSDVMETGVDMKVYESICGHRWTVGEKYYQIMHPDRLRSGLEKVAASFSGDISGDSELELTE